MDMDIGIDDVLRQSSGFLIEKSIFRMKRPESSMTIPAPWVARLMELATCMLESICAKHHVCLRREDHPISSAALSTFQHLFILNEFSLYY
jgi:hypothetical protein